MTMEMSSNNLVGASSARNENSGMLQKAFAPLIKFAIGLMLLDAR